MGPSVTFVEIVDTDMRQYVPSKRRFELSSVSNPSFRREDLQGDACAIRDAAQLHAEVIAPEQEDWKKYFRWTILWVNDRAHMFGPKAEDEDTTCSYELPHDDAYARFRDTMHRFIHVGPMASRHILIHWPPKARPSITRCPSPLREGHWLLGLMSHRIRRVTYGSWTQEAG